MRGARSRTIAARPDQNASARTPVPGERLADEVVQLARDLQPRGLDPIHAFLRPLRVFRPRLARLYAGAGANAQGRAEG